MTTGRTRTALPASVQLQFRTTAVEQDQTLREMHAEAVRWLIGERTGASAKEPPYPYLIVPRRAVNQNVEIDGELIKQAGKVAKKDGVSLRVFLHTALVGWINRSDG